ncbi:MAG: flagellar basal body P-ring protein FlgI, partial [Planctomycetota bacterium]
KNLGNSVAGLDELERADAFAIVQVSMEVPPAGVREGDRLDVRVNTLFNATSLEGGSLVVSPLRLPLPDSPALEPLAIARGPVVIQGTNPRGGVVRDGGQMLRDIRTDPVTQAGTLTLVVKDQYAGFPVATTISSAINDEFALEGYAQIAVVEDAKNIRVLLPAADRARPANFIAALMTIAIDSSLIQTEARIVINEKQGIILVTGNVEIAPVGITHRGLSITSITPGPAGAAGGRRWAGLDTTGRDDRIATGLLDLLAALDQLMVPVEDQIAIIYELEKTGALHAEIVHE